MTKRAMNGFDRILIALDLTLDGVELRRIRAARRARQALMFDVDQEFGEAAPDRLEMAEAGI